MSILRRRDHTDCPKTRSPSSPCRVVRQGRRANEPGTPIGAQNGRAMAVEANSQPSRSSGTYFVDLLLRCSLLFALSAIIFFSIQRLIPGTEAVILAGSLGDSPAQVRTVEKHLGLLKPITSQYADWLVKALHGNFGTSPISGLKISSVIAQQAPVSVELALFGLLIATVLGVPIGALAALSGRRSPRRDMLVRLPFLIFYALPFFVSGAILLLLSSRFFPSIYTAAYVPITSNLGANLRSMILPAIAVGLPGIGQSGANDPGDYGRGAIAAVCYHSPR